MGASSSKRAFFWQKKKSRLERAWDHLKGALPTKKSKRKRILEKLRPGNLKKTKSKKRFSLTDKKETELFKRFSLGNIKKGVRESKGREERRESKEKEKTLKKGEAPSHLKESSQQEAKKADKYENKRSKIVWKSK